MLQNIEKHCIMQWRTVSQIEHLDVVIDGVQTKLFTKEVVVQTSNCKNEEKRGFETFNYFYPHHHF